MNVCLLNDSFPPVIDGVVNVLLNYAEYLKKDHQAEVEVGTPEYPDADYSVYDYPVITYPSLNTAPVTNGYRTGNPFSEKQVAELASFRPDIIHSHCPASATVIARLLREQTDAPVVFTYHTKYDIDIRRYMKVRSIADELIRAMVSNIESCDEVWTVSRGAGESLRELGFQGEYRVMNNGVDFARGRVSDGKVAEAVKDYDLPEGIPVFLYVGRLISYKGLPLILDALGMLHAGGMDFRMVFVGKGPDREILEQKAAEAGLSDKCIFTGPVYDRDVLRAWNTKADLFLFPSTFDTNGLVVREAAACGLASVLIRGSCAAEDITDGRNGFLIDENAEAMAAFLKAACRDIQHLHDVGMHAMDEIYLSWQECVSRAYARYEEVLEEKRRGRLPERRKQASDYLVSMTARGMQEQELMRRLRESWTEDLRSYKVGMMENIQEAEETADRRMKKWIERIRQQYRSHRTNREDLMKWVETMLREEREE